MATRGGSRPLDLQCQRKPHAVFHLFQAHPVVKAVRSPGKVFNGNAFSVRRGINLQDGIVFHGKKADAVSCNGVAEDAYGSFVVRFFQ